MTREEFKRQLLQLQEVVQRALSYYVVWKALILHDKDAVGWSLADRNGVLGRFKGFFTPVAFALLDMALLEFAKMFDTDSKTASLRRLLAAARRDASLVPSISTAELREKLEQVDQNKALVGSLTLMRNQRLAHVQANPAVVDRLLTKDMDKLAALVTEAFNTLSVGHDQNFLSFEFSLRESDRHAAEILGILLDDRDRKRQEFDNTMVEIGLRELHRVEETIGGRIKRSAIRSFIESFGLTPEQMQRVESEYDAGRSDMRPNGTLPGSLDAQDPT